MKFIANILISISNNTIPLGYLLFLIGIICGILSGIGNIKKTNNMYSKRKIEPLIPEIKKQYPNEEEQFEKLGELYKQYHFSVLAPQIYLILSSAIYILVFCGIFYKNGIDLTKYTNSMSFFNIPDIFTRQILIIIPVIIVVLDLIKTLIFIPKEKVKIKDLIITESISIILYAILCNLFIPTYAILLLGKSITECIFGVFVNKTKRKIYDEYPEMTQSQNQEIAKSNPSLKEAIKNLYNLIDNPPQDNDK